MSTPAACPPGADDPGQAIAAARKAGGFTQSELARRAAISLSLLRKIERGSRSLTPGVRAALDAVLAPVPAPADGAVAPERIAAALPQLREVMDAYDIPPDLPYAIRPLAELRHMTSSATAWRLSSQYAKLAGLVPGLITDLTATALNSAGHEQAFGLLALAYRAADAIADKHGRHDMSGRATELIRWAAAHSADPQLEMMSIYVRAELFFSGQHARSGLRMIDSVTPPPPPVSDVPLLAMRGALCMRAAVLAARSGMPGEAADRIAEAQAIARQVPDGVYYGTAFGPGSVRVHELALAVETGDVGRAVKLAGQWQPPGALPAERRSHFHIEAARAHCWAGNRDQAVTALWLARRAAPQHTRCNPAVIETIGVLIRGSRKPPPSLIQLATWIGHP
ncbi:MAG TPA: helix-turn-helix transcriptional regulator [Trebonia sp.]|jgi:transcriptional regulator with XRE-family HTH domain|nr:helix-turn-helix transcriptional regulator [Trebonia sp.]